MSDDHPTSALRNIIMTNTKEQKPLPPGMVLGPDGKPCRVCTAFRDWKLPTNAVKANKKTSSALTLPPSNCPADVEQLGRSTWTFLHTTAAYYPDRPTPTQRANMLCLIRALPVLYPCWHCAGDFGEDLKNNPPDVSSRTALSLWLCQRHNTVNAKLGKESFDCAKTEERWKDGPPDGSCG